MNSQVRHTFVCSGCGETLPLIEMSRMGPKTTYWCYKQSCTTIQELVHAQVRKEIDKQGREAIAYFRKLGDKKAVEIMMSLYMLDKMEPVS